MTCKDCIHYEMCVIVEHQTDEDEDYFTEFGCEDFKNKSELENKINQLQQLNDAMLSEINKMALKSEDPCEYCKHNFICPGKQCPHYSEGMGAMDKKGFHHDWQWCCMDFRYGECDVLENTPCNGCIKNGMKGFEWKGIEVSI